MTSPLASPPLRRRNAAAAIRAKGGEFWMSPQGAAQLRSGRAELARDRGHGLGKLDVQRRDAAGVMRRQNHLYGLVNIAPFRVMVVLFGDQGNPAHEAESFVEILEDEAAADCVPAIAFRPARQFPQSRLPCFRRQTLCHQYLLSYRNRHRDFTFLQPHRRPYHLQPLTMTDL